MSAIQKKKEQKRKEKKIEMMNIESNMMTDVICLQLYD